MNFSREWARIAYCEELQQSEDPNTKLKALASALKDTLPKRESGRHVASRDLGEPEATDSLKAHARKFELLDAA